MGHTGNPMKDSRSLFRDLFAVSPAPLIARAPGRVNLIGEHTDYNDGWVFPMAIDRHVWIAFANRTDPILRVHSVAFKETREVALNDLESVRGSDWFSYVAGVAWAMASSGIDLSGIDMLVDGNVPVGSGLSSSAALEMATARALCEASGIAWHPKKMARLGQKAENEFVGVNCGLMDQMASAASATGLRSVAGLPISGDRSHPFSRGGHDCRHGHRVQALSGRRVPTTTGGRAAIARWRSCARSSRASVLSAMWIETSWSRRDLSSTTSPFAGPCTWWRRTFDPWRWPQRCARAISSWRDTS